MKLFGRSLARKHLLGGLLGLTLLGSAGAAFAAHRHGGHGPWSVLMKMNLSADQKELARSIGQEWRGERQTLGEQKHKLMNTVFEELAKANPDRARIDAAIEEAVATLRSTAKEGTDDALRFHATMTPEQRQRLATLRKDFEQHHQRRQEKRRDHHEGRHQE